MNQVLIPVEHHMLWFVDYKRHCDTQQIAAVHLHSF